MIFFQKNGPIGSKLRLNLNIHMLEDRYRPVFHKNRNMCLVEIIKEVIVDTMAMTSHQYSRLLTSPVTAL